MDNEIFININRINTQIIKLFLNLKESGYEDFKQIKLKNKELRENI